MKDLIKTIVMRLAFPIGIMIGAIIMAQVLTAMK